MRAKTNMDKGFVQFLTPIIVSIATILSMAFWVSNYATLDDLDNLSVLKVEQNYGSTLTSITGSTKLSDLDTILTTNFNALNADKIEISTTTLPLITTLSNLVTVGTLTSGALSTGFTAVPVSLGGTGTTSPTSNMVMLGNGSSGLKVVAGLGTSGQFLTSAGASSPPTWTTSAIDTGIDYTWTGFHTFASTTYMATTSTAGLIASSTSAHPLTLNGVNYTMPSAVGASSTVPMTDASGNITWNMQGWELLAVNSGNGEVTATTTFAAKQDLRVIMDFATTSDDYEFSTYVNGNYSAGPYTYSYDGTKGSENNTWFMGQVVLATTSAFSVIEDIINPSVSYQTKFAKATLVYDSGNADIKSVEFKGKYTGSGQITSITIRAYGGVFGPWKIRVYGR